jgi:hypothetical protein
MALYPAGQCVGRLRRRLKAAPFEIVREVGQEGLKLRELLRRDRERRPAAILWSQSLG